MRRTLSSLALSLLLAAPLAAQAPSTDADYQALGRKYAEWFLAGRGDSLMAHLNAEDRAKTSAAEFVDRRDQLVARAGLETAVLLEQMNRRKGFRQYWREASYSNMPEPVVLRFLMNDAGEIVGVGMTPKSQTPAPDPS